MKCFKIATIVCATLFMMNCGGSSGNGGDPGTGKITAKFKSLTSGSITDQLSAGLPFTLNDFGAASVGAGGLTSFKMYISSIQFCEDLTVNGSGYSNPTNCTTVYENGDDNYDSFDVAAAEAVGAGKYFDLLSASGRAAMTSEVTLDPGTYNVGIINWYRPIKVTAAVPLKNGDTLYTKSCPSTGACEVTGMDAAPAEESIVDFNNGGTWMKFLKPLVVDGTEDFTIDLAYDLDQRIFGGEDISNGMVLQPTGCGASDTGYCGIYMPILRLVPVAHKASESTVVETYEMGGASAEWKIRVDVYYNSGDADKAVLAADLFPIPTNDVDSSIAAGVYVYTVSETDGVTTFKDVDGNPQLSDFTRADSGTAKLKCPSGASLVGCPAGTTVDLTWSSRTIRTL